MPWVKLDDRFPSHRKIALLSDRAFRLHVSAICWCAENLTDGRIDDRELALVAHVRSLKATAKQLEDAGVWDRVDGGWEIHDYLDYNPSREQVLAERKKNAERQERFRKRKNGKPVPPDGNGSSNGVTSTGVNGPETHDGDTNAARRRHDDDTTALRTHPVSEADQQVSAIRNGVTNDAPYPTRPEPLSMADVDGGGTGSSAHDRDAFGAPTPIEVDGFQLNDSMRRWCHATYPGLDVDHATAQFVSHYRSTGARRKSWPDAWQKWIRDDAKRAAERRSFAPSNVIALPGQTAPLTGTDARVAGWLALASGDDTP